MEKIKSNPKFFFSYAKSLSKIKSSINMLFDSNQANLWAYTQHFSELVKPRQPFTSRSRQQATESAVEVEV